MAEGIGFIFIIGLFIGSFLNVLADRLPREEAVIKGRSHCEKCKKDLEWYDLIPLLSFVSLRGKCRFCKAELSYYYPVIELTTGIMFAGIFLFVGGANINFITTINIITLIYYLFIISSLIVVFFTDLKYGIIPDKVIFPAMLFALIFNFQFAIFNQFSIFNSLMSSIGASLFFLLLFLITRGKGMGFGDVKFAFLMGLILGFPKIVVSLYIAFLTGAVVGIILILWRKKKLAGASIPFGPFLVLGTFLALFWGDAIFQKIMPLLSL